MRYTNVEILLFLIFCVLCVISYLLSNLIKLIQYDSAPLLVKAIESLQDRLLGRSQFYYAEISKNIELIIARLDYSNQIGHKLTDRLNQIVDTKN
jgi:hypothetical protein